jgi:hypothetical protein
VTENTGYCGLGTITTAGKRVKVPANTVKRIGCQSIKQTSVESRKKVTTHTYLAALGKPNAGKLMPGGLPLALA